MSANPPPDVGRTRTPRPVSSSRPTPYAPVFAPTWGRVQLAPPSITRLLYGR